MAPTTSTGSSASGVLRLEFVHSSTDREWGGVAIFIIDFLPGRVELALAGVIGKHTMEDRKLAVSGDEPNRVRDPKILHHVIDQGRAGNL